jgi:hypothetical protein
MTAQLTNFIYPLYENPILYIIIQTLTGCNNQTIGVTALATSTLNILDPNTQITLITQQVICPGQTVNLQYTNNNTNNNIKIVWTSQGINVFNNNVEIVQYIRSSPPFNCQSLTQTPSPPILQGGLISVNPSNCGLTGTENSGQHNINIMKILIPGIILITFFIVFILIILKFGKK